LTDWYETKSAHKVGFTGRPVIGGVFMRMLYEKPVWQKYAGRDRTKAHGWAPMPKAPAISHIVSAADTEAAVWRYTTTQPVDKWFTPEFDASSWAESKAGFGQTKNPNVVINTPWTSDDIWLRREVDLSGPTGDITGWLSHDDDAEVYVNGVLAIKAPGANGGYEEFSLNRRSQNSLKPGKNVIAIHCRNTGGEQYIDFGLIKFKAD
jgi:hypothetical protein